MTRSDGKSRMDMLDWRAEAFSRQAPPTHAGQESLPSAPSSPRHLLDTLIQCLASGSWDGPPVGRTPKPNRSE